MAEPAPQGQRSTTRRRRRSALAASVVLVLAGGVALWQGLSQDSPPPRVATSAAPVFSSPKDEQKTREVSDKPRARLPAGHKPASGPSIARLIIPAIGVRAPLIKLGLNSDETLQVPSKPDVTGWWAGGARPGGEGAAVIVGHIDSLGGPAVFHDLGNLRNGDRVTIVNKRGTRSTYVVTGQTRVPKNAFPTDEVYADTKKRLLRLITCTGEFNEARGHYQDNLIVFGRAV